MSRRDDMVIVPGALPHPVGSTRPRAREARRLAGAKKGKGILRRVAQAKLARKVAQRRKLKGRASRAAARGLGRAAGTRAASTPIGLVIAAGIAAGIAVARLASGMPFEGMGSQANAALLGDHDEEARASMQVRRRFQADDDLSRIMAKSRGQNAQLKSVRDDLYKLALKREKGATSIREAIPINNTADMVILRAADKVAEVWAETGGAMLDDLRRAYNQWTGR